MNAQSCYPDVPTTPAELLAGALVKITQGVDPQRLLLVAIAHRDKWAELAERLATGERLDGRASIYTDESYAQARDRWGGLPGAARRRAQRNARCGMKVYLAAPYGSRGQIRQYAAELEVAGFDVTSTWLEETHEINDGTQGAATALPDEVVAGHAEADLTDIELSDVLVLFTSAYVGVEGGGGRHVETGYAIARGTPVVVVGEPENVFHRLNQGVHRVADWAHAKGVLERWSA